MALNPQWLEGVDVNKPIAELIDQAWLEEEAEIALTLEEIAALEEQGQEYIEELYAQGMLGELAPPDIPDRLLQQAQDKSTDFGR